MAIQDLPDRLTLPTFDLSNPVHRGDFLILSTSFFNHLRRMNTEQMLLNLLLSGLLGLIGQGVRVIVGLKKLTEEATETALDNQALSAANGNSVLATPMASTVPVISPGGAPLNAKVRYVYDEKFDNRKIWLSLFIGFIAGCLAGLVREEQATDTIEHDVV